MSKIFHPDRHHDPVKKKQADVFFNKIKNAYESMIKLNVLQNNVEFILYPYFALKKKRK